MIERRYLQVICTFFILLSFPFYPIFAQTIAIKVGHLIDPMEGTIQENQTILIEMGKIKAIGSNLAIDDVDKQIDLSESWVMPGLIDCHVHITLNFPYHLFSFSEVFVKESTAQRALLGAYNAELFLNHGFTTIKDIGNDANYATADVIKAIENGWVSGPTIIYSGKIIAPYGGQVTGINPEYEGFSKYEYIDADSHDEIKKAIRQNIYYGASTIKLVSSDEYSSYYDIEDIKVAVKEAKKSNLKVTVHTLGGEPARNVILGGAAAIEHGFDLDDELLNLMKEHGTFLVGTDFWITNLEAYGTDSAYNRTEANKIINRLKRAYEIGVKMAYGTDIAIDNLGMNRMESSYQVLKTWKAAGIPPNEILKCMTFNAAELLGIENVRGVLAPSYWADIIATRKNPLKDIENLKTVHFVMKNGRVVK